MGDFITWDLLATFAGAMNMVVILTQWTKDFSFLKNLPTRIWSYILSIFVLLVANAFLGLLSVDIVFQSIFNAVIVSLSANGEYELLQTISTKLRTKN